ncbi:MAG: response regulator transcription factor [Mangrovicoccus sp.]
MEHHVLLIEDEPNITEALRFILARDGWRVSCHADGGTALQAIERHRPDVLVLDVMLPGRSGFEILRDLRQGTELRDLPVLMLTARGQSKEKEKAESYGANDFMSKPFSNSELVERLHGLLSEA